MKREFLFGMVAGLAHAGVIHAMAWLHDESVPEWGALLAIMVGVHVGIVYARRPI